jgi:hypothetical protein
MPNSDPTRKYYFKFMRYFPDAYDPNMTSVFRHMKRFWATESILDQKKCQKTHVEERKTLPELVPRGISKKMVDLTCTTDGHVCIISINCNKTAEFSST